MHINGKWLWILKTWSTVNSKWWFFYGFFFLFSVRMIHLSVCTLIALKTSLQICQSGTSMEILMVFFPNSLNWWNQANRICEGDDGQGEWFKHAKIVQADLFEFVRKLIFPSCQGMSTHLISSLTFMDRESSCLHLDNDSYIWYLD